ncbi:hypothetical protein NPIL_494991 [Nephila pilipes]|uniref:DUF7041 domain-containing protein n=1 Tax=Nephila pilipes TaxID=299642 RepID=A0A8X6U4P3_NEPPI|nr:hypothetical protein NPIL_494991 [Nephila pilipes]
MLLESEKCYDSKSLNWFTWTCSTRITFLWITATKAKKRNLMQQPQRSAEQHNFLLLRSFSKVPSFSKPDPKIWFLQLEAQSRNVKLTVDQAKYDYVISSTEPDILSQVSDIFLSPPPDGKYQTIKEKLTSLYADSKTEKT